MGEAQHTELSERCQNRSFKHRCSVPEIKFAYLDKERIVIGFCQDLLLLGLSYEQKHSQTCVTRLFHS